MKKLCFLTLLTLLGAVSLNTSAAVISFDDDTGIQDGTLSYDGAGGALSGSGIDFYSILGIGTPSNSGSGSSLTCVGCTLNFTTGANISEGPLVWEFGGGGSLTITGTAQDSLSNTIATGTLVSGTFSGATITGDGIDNSVLIMSGFGTDEKHSDLLDYFGLSGLAFTFADTNISLGNVDFDQVNTGDFTGTVTNADFDNTAAVPVPAAVWLFGSGLLGLVGVARRRKA